MNPFYVSDRATIYHGDCLDVMRQLPASSADAVITDPPYCSGGATEATRASATHQGLRSETIRSGRFQWFDADNMTTSGIACLLRMLAVESGRLMKVDGSLLAFCDWRMATNVGPAMESAGFRQRNLIVWNKGHFGCGNGFRPQHELIIHLTRRSAKFHAKDTGNVIDAKRVPSKSREHPTEKPIELMEKLIRVASPIGGTIVDPFAGGGSTGVACLRSGRRFVGVEIDERYCEIAAKKLEKEGTR